MAVQSLPAWAPPINPVGGSTGSSARKKSDQRFRSFAERYLIARASFFRQEPTALAEDTWSCLLDAKRAYAMVRRLGESVDPEDM